MREAATKTSDHSRVGQAKFYEVLNRQRKYARKLPPLGTGIHDVLTLGVSATVICRVELDATCPPKAGDALLSVLDSDPAERNSPWQPQPLYLPSVVRRFSPSGGLHVMDEGEWPKYQTPRALDPTMPRLKRGVGSCFYPIEGVVRRIRPLTIWTSRDGNKKNGDLATIEMLGSWAKNLIDDSLQAQTTIEILGNAYHIRGDMDAERMKKLGRFIDKVAGDVVEAVGEVSFEKVLALTALNIADRLPSWELGT